MPTRTMRLSATAHAVLFCCFAFLPTLPEGAYSDERVAALFGPGGDRGLIVVAGALLAGAGLALLPFLAVLSDQVRAAGRGTAASVAPLAGVLHVAALMVASTSFSGYATGLAIEELPVPADTTLARVLSNQGFHTLLVPGLLAAGVMIVAATLALRPALPTWLRRTSWVLAGLTLLGAAWVPQFVPTVWALLVAWGLNGEHQRRADVSLAPALR